MLLVALSRSIMSSTGYFALSDSARIGGFRWEGGLEIFGHGQRELCMYLHKPFTLLPARDTAFGMWGTLPWYGRGGAGCTPDRCRSSTRPKVQPRQGKSSLPGNPSRRSGLELGSSRNLDLYSGGSIQVLVPIEYHTGHKAPSQKRSHHVREREPRMTKTFAV